MFKPIKHIKITIPILMFLSIIGFKIPITHATEYGETCQLRVLPYNTTAANDTLWDNATPYLNDLDATCKNHLKYPDQSNVGVPYTPDPPLVSESPLKAGSEGIRVPWAEHQHAYFNGKDATKPGELYYYESFVDRFEITIQPDGYKNLDLGDNLQNLYCWTYKPLDYQGDTTDLEDCNGSSGVFGGTTVSKVRDPVKKTVTIKWQFATSGAGRPKIYANNGNFTIYKENGTVDKVIDLTDPKKREFPFHVELLTKNNPGEIWSATTTSQVLLADLALKKTNYPQNFSKACIGNDYNNPGSGWCYLEPSSNYTKVPITTPSGTHNFYWFPIGSVGSIWRKPAAPPPPPLCQGLTITNPDATDGVLEYTPGQPFTYNFNIETNPTNLTGHTYKWNDNTFGDNPTNQGTFDGQPSPYSDTNKTVTYVNPNPKPNMAVIVQAYQGSSMIQMCSDAVVLKPKVVEKACTSLQITNPDAQDGILEFTPGQPFNYNFNVQAVTTGGLQLDYMWNTTPVSGTFDNTGNPYLDTNITTAYSSANPVDGAVIKVKGVQAATGGTGTQYSCEDTVTLKAKTVPPPPPACQGLVITNPDAQDGTIDYLPGQPLTYTFNIETSPTSLPGFTYKWDDNTFGDNPNNKGTFDSQNGPYFDTDKTLTYVNPNPKAGSAVIVQAYQGNNMIQLCSDGVVLKPLPPPPPKACTGLQITNPDAQDGIVEFDPGQPFNYNFNIQAQTTGGMQLNYRWSDNPVSGKFDNSNNNPYDDTDTTTSYSNPNPVDNTTVLVRGFEASTNGPVAGNICYDSIILKAKTLPPPVCSEITVNSSGGNVLNENQSSLLTAFGQNTNGTSINQFRFTTTGGTLQSFCNGQFLQGSDITVSNICPVNFLGGPAGTSINVTSIPSSNDPDCTKTITVKKTPEVCSDVTPIVNQGNHKYCVQGVPSQFTSQIVWDINPNINHTEFYENGYRCVQFPSEPQNVNIRAYVPGAGTICSEELKFLGPPPLPPLPPTIDKGVKSANSPSGYSKVLNLSSVDGKTVEYRINFTPTNNAPTSALLTDTISGGTIFGKYPQLFTPVAGTPTPGRIIYKQGSMMVNGIGQCNSNDIANASNCYTGDISTGLQLYKVTSPITITYRGDITDSAIKDDTCEKGVVCEEIYENTVKGDYNVYDSQNQAQSGQIQSQIVRVQIFCPYILTRASGDIYLETDLNIGIDIHKCTPYKSVTGPIYVPTKGPTTFIPSTGEDKIQTINHEVCTRGDISNLPPELQAIYGDKSSLSSQICEIGLQPGGNWDKTVVIKSIEENKTRISRWGQNLFAGTTITSAKDLPKAVSHVVGNLTIDPSQTFINDGEGAKTVIVEDGNLIIKNNISYGLCTKSDGCKIRETASLAFIVLNGNVIIDPQVTTLAGVYFVQKKDDGTGKLISGVQTGSGVKDYEEKVSNKLLNFFGNVYGDIKPLIKNRVGVGDIVKGEGSIVYRFDQRIILNTPPGLQDLVDVKATEVAR